jgi:hypothetical protein
MLSSCEQTLLGWRFVVTFGFWLAVFVAGVTLKGAHNGLSVRSGVVAALVYIVLVAVVALVATRLSRRPTEPGRFPPGESGHP